VDVADEVRRILADWHQKHDWQPGMIWDPYTAAYVRPAQGTPAQDGQRRTRTL